VACAKAPQYGARSVIDRRRPGGPNDQPGPGERAAARRGCPWRAREAHRPARREPARLVRRLHDRGAGRHAAAGV